MIPASRTFLARLSALALTTLAMVSCSSSDVSTGGEITKVKYYHLVAGVPLNTIDPAIQFERDYHLRGAVTKAEIMERGGHYYTIFWKADDRTQPVTVRFEYRQANSGLTSKVLEEEVTDLRRSNLSRFQVTGDEYLTNGRVTAWRVILLRGNEELSSKESFLWN